MTEGKAILSRFGNAVTLPVTAFYALYNEIECYMLSGACYAYVYPRMVKNLERQLKRFFGVKLK